MEKPKKKDAIRIQDIAEKLNISPSSVSRALNNNERISEETRNLVWKTAKEMGYKLNVPDYLDETRSVKIPAVAKPAII